MTTLTLKNIPEDLHKRLRDCAARPQRSLNGEAVACLRTVLMSDRIDADALLAAARTEAQPGGPSATQNSPGPRSD